MSNIIEITNLNIPELDIYARMSEVQLLHINEPAQGIFIAESPIVIERALDAGYSPISMLVERKHLDGQACKIISRCQDVPVYTSDFEILTKLTGYKLTRGMLCAMQRHTLPSVEDICANARRIAVLENVMNPTNIGAIFRSAAALDVDAVLLTPACSDPLYRRAIRVSMGNVFQIPWTYITSDNSSETKFDLGTDCTQPGLAENPRSQSDCTQPGLAESSPVWISRLNNLGFKTAAMALTDNSVSIDDKELLSQDKLAIVLGTEGEGLLKQTISNCDYTVKIPMSHGVDSLNVAAASAVAFWQLCRKK